MTVTELYNKLCDPGFKDPETGNLFFPAYMYMYNPQNEYQIRAEIENLKDRLIRPNTLVDVLRLNIFEIFCNYLKSQNFGNQDYYSFLLIREEDAPDKILRTLKIKAREDNFFKFLHQQVLNYIQAPGEYAKVYIFLHGFGQIFPYLRVSMFLSKFEQYISGYKMILFYPGIHENNNYKLFSLLNDDNPYRAIKLINE
jgi:hypothetical protein